MTSLIYILEMILLPVEPVTTLSTVDSVLISLSSLGIKVITRLRKFLMPTIKLLIIEEQMEQILLGILKLYASQIKMLISLLLVKTSLAQVPMIL